MPAGLGTSGRHSASNVAAKIRLYLHNEIRMIEKSNRHRTKLTLFSYVNILCMPIFIVSRKGTANYYAEKTNLLIIYEISISASTKRFVYHIVFR